MNEEKRNESAAFQIDEPELLNIESDSVETPSSDAAPEKPQTSKKKKSSRKTSSGKTSSGKRKSGTKSSSSSKKKGSAKRKKKSAESIRNACIHLVFIALILSIAGVGIVKLIRWNEGTESGYDPNEISTEFDTEPEDFFVPLDSATAALQKDDGITSILLLGNGALAKTKGEDDSIANLLESMTKGKVYDASLNHTYLSVKNAVYEESYQSDIFSLYWMTQCITTGDFTLLEDNARSWEGDDTVQETVEMLKNLDMETIDVITIMYDYHDYEDERILAGPYDEAMAATCCGCLLQSIRLIQQAYPHIRIIVSSPYFSYIEDGDDNLQPGSTYDMGQGTLADYMIAFKNIAVNTNVSFIDNYFGTITEDNYKKYLRDNLRYLNEDGRKAVAERIAAFINA